MRPRWVAGRIGFMESNVPEAEREKASDVLVRILNGVCLN